MFTVDAVLFLFFIVTAAWQDIREKSVEAWIYWVFGSLALFLRLCSMESGGLLPEGFGGWISTGGGMAIGVGLLEICHITDGGIGEGDGWFFLISGIYLGFWRNLGLFMYGLFLCGFYCLAISIWGALRGKDMRKRTVPFLPFLVPVGLWMFLG